MAEEEESQSRSFRGPFYELRFPSHWEELVVENIPCFFDPEEGGVVQAVASRSSTGPYQIQAEMARYLEQHKLNPEMTNLVGYKTDQEADALACEFAKEGRFWMVHMLVHGDRMVLLLYNSDKTPDRGVAGEVASILRSVRFL